MRRIPVTLANDTGKLVGYLQIDDGVTDDMLKDTNLAWLYKTATNEILGATLIQKPRIHVENDGEWVFQGRKRISKGNTDGPGN